MKAEIKNKLIVVKSKIKSTPHYDYLAAFYTGNLSDVSDIVLRGVIEDNLGNVVNDDKLSNFILSQVREFVLYYALSARTTYAVELEKQNNTECRILRVDTFINYMRH